MELQAARERIEAYLRAEDAFYRESWTLSDDEQDEKRRELLAAWAVAGAYLLFRGLSGDELGFSELQVRPLFRVESYPSSEKGRVFAAEVGPARQRTRKTVYDSRYLFTEVDGDLRILAVERSCGDCKVEGVVDGRTCSTCRGRGWEPIGQERVLALGERQGLLRISDATSKRFDAANRRP
ncbi:MAG: hypothetical protein KC621_19275 [Myxococcales bacterium]|nr:hypothetical protein [Myxococcales bacterium]